MAALAWNLKAWYELLVPDKKTGAEVVRMEFARFLNGFMALPAQVLKQVQPKYACSLGRPTWNPSWRCSHGCGKNDSPAAFDERRGKRTESHAGSSTGQLRPGNTIRERKSGNRRHIPQKRRPKEDENKQP